MRTFYLWVCMVAIFWLPQARASATSIQPAPIALSQLGADLGAPHITVRENVPRSRSIDSVVSDGTPFTQTFDPSKAYDLDEQSATWLHFRVLASDKSSSIGWTLGLSKPYIDRVEFYQKDVRGAWQMQAAGDHIAHTQWPQQSLNPQFPLAVMAAGVHDFYLKVQGDIPVHFAVQLQRTDTLNAHSQNRFLLGGVLLGVCALMLAYSLVLALSVRQKVYGWYALFVGLSCLATSSHMGLAKYALWPDATTWPEYATYCLVMLGIVAQLQFSRTILLSRAEPSRWHSVLSLTMMMNFVALVLFLLSDNPVHRMMLYALVASACATLAIGLVLRALRQGNQAAWLWLVAYAPLMICVSVASLDNFGFAVNGMPYDAPLYALLFEASVLLVALHLHAKSQQATSVRRSLLDSIDPHTGFVPSRSFAAMAQALWDTTRLNNSELAVAYVEATSYAAAHSQSHIVRMLRTVARDGDTVAHVDKNLYAVLMPGRIVGTDLMNRLSRLVALGLMAVKDLSAGSAVQFRIVASTSAAFAGPWPALDASLRAKLDDPNGWSRKSIRYVRLRSPDDATPDTDLAGLSQLWQAATEESARLDAVKA
jgi:two-component system, sensor histidine kinase LadS